MNAEVTLYRCYWPPAYDYLNVFGIAEFVAKSYDLLMTLELDENHAYSIASLLPAGAIIDIVPVQAEALENQEIDDLLFYSQQENAAEFDKN